MDELFTASTQYNDFTGTAAADDADTDDFSDHLRLKNLIADNEILVGVQMYSSAALFGQSDQTVSVKAYIAGPDMEKFTGRIEAGIDPISVRVVNTEMPAKDFFAFFKRFEVMISRNGELTARNLLIPE